MTAMPYVHPLCRVCAVATLFGYGLCCLDYRTSNVVSAAEAPQNLAMPRADAWGGRVGLEDIAAPAETPPPQNNASSTTISRPVARITGARAAPDESTAILVQQLRAPDLSPQPHELHDQQSVNSAVTSDCHNCNCERCCNNYNDEQLVKKSTTVTVCVYKYFPEEKVEPYCNVKCKEGECTEVFGTKTVRRFVRRAVEELVTIEYWEPEITPKQKCLKCGFQVTDCPKPDPAPQPCPPGHHPPHGHPSAAH